MGTSNFIAGDSQITLRWDSNLSRAGLVVISCFGKGNKLWSDGPLNSNAGLTFSVNLPLFFSCFLGLPLSEAFMVCNFNFLFACFVI